MGGPAYVRRAVSGLSSDWEQGPFFMLIKCFLQQASLSEYVTDCQKVSAVIALNLKSVRKKAGLVALESFIHTLND